MANICTFEMRIKGSKNACLDFFNADFPCYERWTIGEYGDNDPFILYAGGECRYDLHSMDKGDETIAQLAARMGVELEIFGYDMSEPEWIQHFHYSGGKCLHAFDLPTVVNDLEEMKIPQEDMAKYEYREQFDLYVLKNEFNEDFEWDDDEQTMRLPWIIAVPDEN